MKSIRSLQLKKPNVEQRLPDLSSAPNKLFLANASLKGIKTLNRETKPFDKQNSFCRPYLCLTPSNFDYYCSLLNFIKRFCVLMACSVTFGFHLPCLLSRIHFIYGQILCEHFTQFTPLNVIFQLAWQVINFYNTCGVISVALHIVFYLLCGLFVLHIRLDQLFRQNHQLLWIFRHQVASTQWLSRDTASAFSVFTGITYFILGATTCELAFLTFFQFWFLRF